MNLVCLLDQHARNRPHEATILGDEVAIDYETLVRLTSSFAHGLVERGIQEGDRVILLRRNDPGFLIAFLGAMRAGIIPVPVHPGATRSELHALAQDLGTRVVIASRRCT